MQLKNALKEKNVCIKELTNELEELKAEFKMFSLEFKLMKVILKNQGKIGHLFNLLIYLFLEHENINMEVIKCLHDLLNIIC